MNAPHEFRRAERHEVTVEIGHRLIHIGDLRDDGDGFSAPFGDARPGGFRHGQDKPGDPFALSGADRDRAPIIGPRIIVEAENQLELSIPVRVGEPVCPEAAAEPRLFSKLRDARRKIRLRDVAVRRQQIDRFFETRRFYVAAVIGQRVVRPHHVRLIEPFDENARLVIDRQAERALNATHAFTA